MKNKICLVTGGTSGLGLETCLELSALGAQVVMAGRNAQKGEQAIAKIRAKHPEAKIDFMYCDFMSQPSIHEFAAQFSENHQKLDVLVNNAGAVYQFYGENESGIERTFALNHLGYFTTTLLLLPKLKEAKQGRVVVVASDAHYGKFIDPLNYNNQANFKGFEVYGKSKLANMLFTFELARRLEGSRITANCLHPGVVATNLAQQKENRFYRFAIKVAKPFLISSREGAETQVFLSASPVVEGISGKYFDKKKIKRPSHRAQDTDMQKQLWELSERLTGINSAEYI